MAVMLAQSSRSLAVFVATMCTVRDMWDASLGETLECEGANE